MLTTAIKGISSLRPVGGMPGILAMCQCHVEVHKSPFGPRNNSQPVQGCVMGAFEDEFVDHAINAHRSTYQLSFNILGIRVNKMVCVKSRERLSPYAAGELYTSATYRNSSYVAKEHTVGTWLTYGSCTIVAIVCGTDRFSNSQ